MTTVADLLTAGRLEPVPADPAAATARLARADPHLQTAATLVGQDNEVAYGSLYDAARKAIAAHMLANGLRAGMSPGAHAAVGMYALERVPDVTGSIREFQRLRRRRNKSEYEDLFFGSQEVATDLEHAKNIVAVVRAAL